MEFHAPELVWAPRDLAFWDRDRRECSPATLSGAGSPLFSLLAFVEHLPVPVRALYRQCPR